MKLSVTIFLMFIFSTATFAEMIFLSSPSMEEINRALVGKKLPDLADTINIYVSPALPGCFDYITSTTLPKSDYPHGTPLEGALRILASKYQTCQILDNVAGSSTFYGKSPKVLLNWMYKKPPLYPLPKELGCIDSTKLKEKVTCRHLSEDNCEAVKTTPLDYVQGWRINQIKDGIMMVHEAASDCSSFVSSAMMASGLKMNFSSNKSDFTETTRTIAGDYKNGSSCFERQKTQDIKNLISSGEILNDSSGGHVVMIDKLGPDPLGVEAIYDKVVAKTLTKKEALKQCETLGLSAMHLGIIHSTSNKTSGQGIMRESANVISSGVAKKILIGYARGACAHFVSNYPAQKEFDSAEGICETCTILKHKGLREPACVLEKRPAIQGEGCINECLQNRLNDINSSAVNESLSTPVR